MIWIDREKIKELFQQINVWRRGDQRAPHKPLLILHALSKIAAGNKKRIPYSEVDKVLRPLLAQFGPPRKSYHPEQPFWWLQSDGLWELDIDPEIFPRRKSGKNPTKGKDFIVNHVDGKNFHIEKNEYQSSVLFRNHR